MPLGGTETDPNAFSTQVYPKEIIFILIPLFRWNP